MRVALRPVVRLMLGAGLCATAILAVAGPVSARTKHLSIGSVSAIVSSDYRLNNAANADLSYAVQAEHEGGSALTMDDETFRAAKIAGDPTLDGATYSAFEGTVASSSAPPQSTYPLRFIALSPLTSPAGTPSADRVCAGSADVLEFQKDSSASTWKVTNEPSADEQASIPRFAKTASGTGGFATGSGYVTPLNSVEVDYIAAMTAQARTGNGGALLPSKLFATGRCVLELWNPRTDYGVHDGLNLSVSVKALSPRDFVAYQVKGGALALFTLQGTIREAPQTSGEHINWSHGSTLWWDLLPAGEYSVVHWTVDQELAVFVPSTATGGTMRVLAGYSDIVNIGGTAY
ncbi:MAG: hypothetical protein ACRDVC_02070 [Acidimicrobiales bacterium]